MDIKLKKSKSFRIWLCFFIGINIVGFFIMFGIAGIGSIGYFDPAVLGSDFKDTQWFKDNLGNKFDFLASYITYDWDNDDNEHITDEEMTWDEEDKVYTDEEIQERIKNEERREFKDGIHWNIEGLNDEGENLLYYARNPKTGTILTNIDTDLGISKEGTISLPEGYDFYIYYNGDKFIAQKDGKPLDIYHNDNGYRNTLFRDYMEDDSLNQSSKYKLKMAAQELNGGFSDIRGCQIFLVVNKDLMKSPYGYSQLYRLNRDMKVMKYAILASLGILILGVGLFVFSIVKREYKREFEKRIGRFLGKISLELKILASLMLLFLVASILNEFYWADFWSELIVILTGFWWLYLLWIDLRNNGRNVLSKNIINGMIKKYRKFEEKRPFQKAQLFRLYTLIGVEISLVFFIVVFMIISAGSGEWSFSILALILVGIGIYLLYRYVRRYAHNLDDIGKVIDQTERIRQGDMKTRLQLSPDADLYMLEDNLNTIQEGITRAVENSVKSERMKVELITNVSHDLKTPLTSIISYVDLLLKEEDLPEHVKDYIRVLAQKSERLKLLIQDLFDLSKAVSGEMEFEMKTLDLSKLIEQTLADLEDKIIESQLIFRVNLPDSPVPIVSDGNKLYRVFLNLFQNTLKYSLTGTRVYVDLVNDDGKATVTIKNTSNYEMNFSEEEIIERFVRGDKARSDEGSGLGLAIAQNFTRACGGVFDIKVDGDLFKVILYFDVKPDKDIENDNIK